jgi:hypothetical protein
MTRIGMTKIFVTQELLDDSNPPFYIWVHRNGWHNKIKRSFAWIFHRRWGWQLIEDVTRPRPEKGWFEKYIELSLRNNLND